MSRSPLAVRIGVVVSEQLVADRVVPADRAHVVPELGMPLISVEPTPSIVVPAGADVRFAIGEQRLTGSRIELVRGLKGRIEVPGAVVLVAVVAAVEPVTGPVRDFRPRVDPDDALLGTAFGGFAALAVALLAVLGAAQPKEFRPEQLPDVPWQQLTRVAPPAPATPTPTVSRPTSPTPRPSAPVAVVRTAPSAGPTDTERLDHFSALLTSRGSTSPGTAVDRWGDDQAGAIAAGIETGSESSGPADELRHTSGRAPGAVAGGTEVGAIGVAAVEVAAGPAVRTSVVERIPSPADEGAPDPAIGRAFDSFSHGVQYCYDLRLKNAPDLSGKLTFDWEVENGRVVGFDYAENTVRDADLEGCIASRARNIQFPSTFTGTVERAWVLRPAR